MFKKIINKVRDFGKWLKNHAINIIAFVLAFIIVAVLTAIPKKLFKTKTRTNENGDPCDECGRPLQIDGKEVDDLSYDFADFIVKHRAGNDLCEELDDDTLFKKVYNCLLDGYKDLDSKEGSTTFSKYEKL